MTTAHGELSGFSVLSMTFVSDVDGYALGTVKCASGRCVSVLRTRDGGTHWTRVRAPATHPGGLFNTCPTHQPCVAQIRFATPLIGYAFDPSLFVTTDGGLRWHQLRGLSVTSLEAAGGAGGTAVRVASNGQGCSGMPYKVQSANVAAFTWHLLPAPPLIKICPPTLYRQGQRLALAAYGNAAGGVRALAAIAVSEDGGATWKNVPDKCGGKDGYAARVTIAPPHVLVLLCRHQMTLPGGGSGPAWVRVSTNDGATFGPDRPVVASHGFPAKKVFAYGVAAASASRLVVIATSAHRDFALVSQNGGRIWSTRLSIRSASADDSNTFMLIGFQDPLTARIALGNRVWTTVDGGNRWKVNLFKK
ncbi:MAG TPA: sialidase family protein [Streptosporangiaceae bacterium]|nr:sialidase family protein [Streptosporangiaceae bacterium]